MYWNGGIYKLTSPSGKAYIGQSLDLKRRMRSYREANCRGQIALYRAIKKYGWDKFKVEILVLANDRWLLNETETKLIALYDTMKNGYNLSPGGDGSILSAEARAKIASANRKRVITPETRAKLSAAAKRLVHTPELIAKRAASIRNSPKAIAHRAKQNGRPHSEQHKANISAGLKRRRQHI